MSNSGVAGGSEALTEILRKLDEQAAEIAELREEGERLGRTRNTPGMDDERTGA